MTRTLVIDHFWSTHGLGVGVAAELQIRYCYLVILKTVKPASNFYFSRTVDFRDCGSARESVGERDEEMQRRRRPDGMP